MAIEGSRRGVIGAIIVNKGNHLLRFERKYYLKFLAASSAASMAFSSSAVLGADPEAPEMGVALATCNWRSASVNHSNIM